MPTLRFPDGPLNSASHGFAITPHATNPLEQVTRALWVGGAGNIAVRFRDGSADVTIVGVPAGMVLDFAVTHVRAAGTTATNIVGLA
jgi:hypothetical protein